MLANSQNASDFDNLIVRKMFTSKHLQFGIIHAGRKIAPNTGANATKFFTLATKS